MRRWITMLAVAVLAPVSMASAEQNDSQFLNDEQIIVITDEVLSGDFSTFTELDVVDALAVIGELSELATEEQFSAILDQARVLSPDEMNAEVSEVQGDPFIFDDEFGLDSPGIDTDYIWYPINPWLPLGTNNVFGHWVKDRGYHLGDDCIRSAGTPIYAIYDGNVRYARYNSGGWGYLMIVESMFNNLVFCTVYGHLGRTMYPGEGRSVGRGQYIGTVGSTGESGQNPPHLHLGIHMGGYDAPTGQYPAWCKGYGTSTNGWQNPTDFIARY